MSNSITTWIRAYFALRDRAAATRGIIELNPGTPDAELWPRTTGSDVVLIASVIDPLALRHVADSTVRRWQLAMADVEELALDAPNETYVENRAFWRALAATFVDFHADSVPVLDATVWDRLLAQLGTTDRRNGGPTGAAPFGPFTGVATFSDLYRAQVRLLLDKRGFDLMDAPPGHPFGGANMKIPRTTNADVISLATYWSKALAGAKHVQGYDYVADKWASVTADVAELAKAAKPDGVYAKNNELWRELPNVSSKITEGDLKPSTTDLVIESVANSVAHLPENIAAAAKAIGSGASNIAAKAANAIGHVANEAGKGAFAGFGLPLLLGAGALGVFLIARRRGNDSDSATEE